jgi:hypothetical protein
LRCFIQTARGGAPALDHRSARNRSRVRGQPAWGCMGWLKLMDSSNHHACPQPPKEHPQSPRLDHRSMPCDNVLEFAAARMGIVICLFSTGLTTPQIAKQRSNDLHRRCAGSTGGCRVPTPTSTFASFTQIAVQRQCNHQYTSTLHHSDVMQADHDALLATAACHADIFARFVPLLFLR